MSAMQPPVTFIQEVYAIMIFNCPLLMENFRSSIAPVMRLEIGQKEIALNFRHRSEIAVYLK